MHLNEGQLRAYLDGELNGPGQAAAEHLASCAVCQARLQELEARVSAVGQWMAGLEPGPADRPLAARAALARFHARRDSAVDKENTNMLQSLFSRKLRGVWVGVGVVLALVVAFSFAPVRTWAGEFLGLFRVQRITVVQVDATRFNALNDDSTLGDQISQMFSESVKTVREPGDPQEVADVNAASQAAGFQVRLPQGDAPSQIVVEQGPAYEITVDLNLAQAVLNDAGRGDLQLPASLDGAKLSVDVPTGVSAAYGECPDMAALSGPEATQASDTKYDQPRDCLILAELPSPTVDMPPDVDIAQLAEIGLEFTGMTPEEAQAFSQTVDWTSTLVIPIPRNGAGYEQVAVDGTTGNLIYRNPDSVWKRYTLLWVKDGVVYGLTGYGDPQDGIALANTLQ
jgi:hypothetical protein